MKVTVCEFPDEASRRDAAWTNLVRFLKTSPTDVVVLPEMPSCDWKILRATSGHRRWPMAASLAAVVGRPTTVEWSFVSREDRTTFVSITNAGFAGDGDEVVKQATDSTQGFSFVLAGLKALLEHDVRLNLVPDRYPKGLEEH